MLTQMEKQTEKSTVNYLLQTCSSCNAKMELVEGSLLFDGKWYHENCWQSNNNKRNQGTVN